MYIMYVGIYWYKLSYTLIYQYINKKIVVYSLLKSFISIHKYQLL